MTPLNGINSRQFIGKAWPKSQTISLIDIKKQPLKIYPTTRVSYSHSPQRQGPQNQMLCANKL